MDVERWEWIQKLFHEAALLPEAGRHAFLAAACGADAEAMNEVLSLLQEDARNTSLLDRDLGQIADRVVGEAPPGLTLQTIGPYRILKLLGEGGMGVVYLAEREDLGSRVAIKILPNAWMSPARRERFALEERTQSRLNHPSIARLYDAGTLDNGTPWFAMEYVEGLPLTEHCAKRGASLDERLHLFRSVCEAVQYAHQQAVLHRDLKPSNILVRNGGAVSLLDFGIAKQLDRLEAADLTRTGLRLATPAYAAPEQIRGEPPAIQADVYSLGVILYELLSGRPPFAVSDRTPIEAAIAIATKEPEKPSVAGRESLAASRAVWSDLDVLCLTAMHRDSRRRYQSVEGMIRDIDHLLKNEPLEARPDNFGYKLGKFVRRNRRSLVAASAALTVVAAMLVYFTVRLTAARDAALAETARAQRIQQFMMHLFEGGEAYVGPAEDLRVVTLIDRSARDAQMLDTDPATQADLYETLGSVYQNLGKFDQAEQMFQAALERRNADPGKDGARVSENLVAFGLLRVDQGKHDDAERLVREGLELARTILPPAHPSIAAATAALGRVLLEQGRYEEAGKTLEQALRLTPAAAPTQPLATALIRLANVHFYAGRYGQAETLSRRVLDMYQRMYGERHPIVSDPIINLGAIAQQGAKYGEAERLYRQALDLNRSYYGDQHPETAASLIGIGRALLAQKRLDEAEPVLSQVLAIRERAYGSVHPNVASSLSSLGHLEMERGNLTAAEERFRRMAEIYREVNGDGHHFVGIAMTNLGTVYLERKDYSRAEASFRDVLRRYEDTLPPDHLDVGIARIKLGRALLRQGRYPEAEEHSRAGLEILEKKTGPSAPWLVSAREDLAEIHERTRTATP